LPEHVGEPGVVAFSVVVGVSVVVVVSFLVAFVVVFFVVVSGITVSGGTCVVILTGLIVPVGLGLRVDALAIVVFGNDVPNA
jgi:hypothetical protein